MATLSRPAATLERSRALSRAARRNDVKSLNAPAGPFKLQILAKKPKRARTVRREAARATAGLVADRERLFVLEPGGAPERPISVETASIVELRALSVRCPRCEGEHRLVEHAAVVVQGVRLREARLSCRACGARRSLWFRLPMLN